MNDIDSIRDRLGWYESTGDTSDIRFLITELINICDAMSPFLDERENDFKLESQIQIANKTINQFSNEMVRLKKAAWDAVGESGLNGSIEKLEKVLNDLEGKEISNAT